MVVVLGLLSLVAFDSLFVLFHQVVFPGGGWSFDPASQRLVQLYPFVFWQIAAAAFGLLVLLLGSLTWWLGRRLGRSDGPTDGDQRRLPLRRRPRTRARLPAMAQHSLVSLEEARQRILRDVLPLRAETLPLSESLGRVLAVDANALLTLPPWDNSAMDGFAVRSEDVAGADAGRTRQAARGR